MIPEGNPYNNWSGNGSTTTFDFDFYIEDSSQLEVYYTDTSGTQVQLTEDVDYTINEVGNEDGSYITFPVSTSSYSVLKEGEVISLVMSVPITQEEEYTISSKLNLEQIEYSLDKLTRICKILKRELERSAKVAEGNDVDTDELVVNINTLTAYLSVIEAVNNNSANINAVNDNEENINIIAADISNVNSAADNIKVINAVSDNKSNINSVCANETNINTTAENISDINIIASDITNVDLVANDLTNIDTAAENISDINTVAADISNVNSVADNIKVINAVNDNESNINSVCANETNINTVAENIKDVQNAYSNAQTAVEKAAAASKYADNAQIWAEGTDVEVAALGGEHSSKVWAEQSVDGANVGLTNLSDIGENKLEAQKGYYTGNVLTDSTEYAQLVDMAHSTFDSSKLTVVGEPTVTEDGIVDNFSSSNYLEYTGDFAFNSCESFEIVFPAFNVASYDTGSTASQSICSFRNSNTIFEYIPIRLYETWNGKICKVVLYDSEQNKIGELNISNRTTEGTVLYVKMAWDGSTYSSYSSLDGIEWTKTDSIESTTPLADSDSITFGHLTGTTYTRSYIDMKPFKAVINGIPVSSFNKTGTDTVTIDDEEVEIPYTLSSTGSKIVDAEYRSRVQNLYEQDGKALYYTLDETNNNFTLPMGEIYGMMKSYIDENTASINESIEETTAYVYPIGEPHITLSDTLNDNEIWLEGAEVSKTTYAALYEIYGDTYGTPEDENNFVLPDFRNRVIQGSDEFGYIEAGLPNATGSLECVITNTARIWSNEGSGALYNNYVASSQGAASMSGTITRSSDAAVRLDLSKSNSIYGNSDTVQPPAIQVRVKTRYI